MGKLTIVKNRVYADYLMPSRMEEYEDILKSTLDSGYEYITVRDYYDKLSQNKLENKKYFVNRHDIDTDKKMARIFFEIEKKYNVRATYYFRLSTLDIELMKEIEAYGSEASYHFEEIATYCKQHHLKSQKNVFENMENIQKLFKKNFRMIENALGSKLQTVCSHGDFVNRKLALTNVAIIKSQGLREELGIVCETYDKIFKDSFDIYVADRPYPLYYTPENIFKCIGKYDKIYMLSHPRQWRSNIIVNTIENLKRVYEDIKW
ncbi:hypothetical protein KKC13_03710 [bacterium]|nr:hypothetical protein [bacterium]MBU1957266.1 hypothetical protein [bacterium]